MARQREDGVQVEEQAVEQAAPEEAQKTYGQAAEQEAAPVRVSVEAAEKEFNRLHRLYKKSPSGRNLRALVAQAVQYRQSWMDDDEFEATGNGLRSS